MIVDLCDNPECLLLKGHAGKHQEFPNSAWQFLKSKDKNKIAKAGFATPRGGDKGAYQNHVNRNNKVIVPFERLGGSNPKHFTDGYVIRLFPDQYFLRKGVVRPDIDKSGINVGENAFVLYRTHEQLTKFPPLKGWVTRYIEQDGAPSTKRSATCVDKGHYVLRISAHGAEKAKKEGPPQGIFAPEYSSKEENYLAQALLAWLIANCVDAPYVSAEANWLESILLNKEVLNRNTFEHKGITRNGITSCPLCMRNITYTELHEMLNFNDEDALANASVQNANSTRSTVVNLFHLLPLTYSDMLHNFDNVAWGHATCNTKLGQRRCFSLEELKADGHKIAVLTGDQISTIGWANPTLEMIRSPFGAVWIRITQDADGNAL